MAKPLLRDELKRLERLRQTRSGNPAALGLIDRSSIVMPVAARRVAKRLLTINRYSAHKA